MPDQRSERPHWAALLEDRWNLVLGRLLARRGWRHHVVAHTGYAGPGFVRVLARVVLAPPGYDPAAGALVQQRGWRSFLTAEALDVPVTVTLEGRDHEVRTDRSGNIDVRLPDPGLTPGWSEATLRTADSSPATARVLVVDADAPLGIVSDIDDTVLTTHVPRPLLAAYHTLLAREVARRPVPGMADLFSRLLADHPAAPVVYVSTGAWNTGPRLRRFLVRHGLPDGPLLLTDWGPTNTGWFRSGQEHKRACLESLVQDFPRISWLLVGDDGQHDPAIYADLAQAHPDHVRAIAIRRLRATEQVLSHGSPSALADGRAVDPVDRPGVPEVRGADGAEIADRLLPLL